MGGPDAQSIERERHRRSRPTAVALVLFLCLAWRAGAAPEARAAESVESAKGTGKAADPARPVEEIIVRGETQTSMDVLAGATATRIETDARLVEGQQLADVLADVPGVQVRRFGGVGDRFEISIRGSRPEQVPVFLDGVRLDTSLTGSSDLSALCLDVLQEVQVVRGPGAARAGTGAIGGVVNLVSREPTAVPETRVRLSGGNFESVEGSLRHARQIGDWGVSLAYCGFHTQGDFRFQQAKFLQDGVPVGNSPVLDRINNESDRHTAIAHVGGALGPGELRITELVTHLERGVPGSEFDQRPNAEERDISALTSVAFDMPLAALPGASLDLSLAHRYEGNDYRDPDASIGGDPIDTETDVHNLTARSGARYERDLLAGHHRFSVLGEGRFDERSSNEANQKSRAGGALRIEVESSWLAERLSLAPSLRMERFQGFDLEWIPGLHLRARPLPMLELHAAAARSYRVPSFQELYMPDRGFERGNENLRPEDAESVEVGTTLYSPFDAAWLDFEIEATWFWSRIDDSIAYQLISTNVVAPVNTGRSKTHGYELALRYSPHPWLRLIASRTVTQAEIDDGDSPIPGIAASLTDVRIELGPADVLKLVGELHYTGRIPVSGGGAASLPSRTSYDASASIDLARIEWLPVDQYSKSLWLSVRGRNLANESIRDGKYLPRPGRNFAVALEGVF